MANKIVLQFMLALVQSGRFDNFSASEIYEHAKDLTDEYLDNT